MREYNVSPIIEIGVQWLRPSHSLEEQLQREQVESLLRFELTKAAFDAIEKRAEDTAGMILRGEKR